MKALTFDDLTFQLRESARRRTMEIMVDRDGSLVLATPPDVPLEVLESLVEEKRLWVYGKLLEKESQVRPRAPKEYVSGEGFFYLGRSYRLRVVNGARQEVPLRLYRSRFELCQEAVTNGREQFVEWYTIHLRPVLERHITALARRVAVEPGRVHVQDMGYRWGSCDRRRHLYFHWRVAMLPHSMIEYLVAHELVHLIERSHNAAFWERLERVIPDYPSRQQSLRERGGMYDL